MEQYHLDAFGQSITAGDFVVGAYNGLDIRPFRIRKITDKMVSLETVDNKRTQMKSHRYPKQLCRVSAELVTLYMVKK